MATEDSLLAIGHLPWANSNLGSYSARGPDVSLPTECSHGSSCAEVVARHITGLLSAYEVQVCGSSTGQGGCLCYWDLVSSAVGVGLQKRIDLSPRSFMSDIFSLSEVIERLTLIGDRS